MFKKRVAIFALVLFMIIGNIPMVSAERITIDIGNLSSWENVSNYLDDSVTDAGGGGYELKRFYITNDETNMYYRWDIPLTGNQVDLKSTNLGVALSTDSDPATAEIMVWMLFDSKGDKTYSLVDLVDSKPEYFLSPETDIWVFNEGTKEAMVSVVSKVPFAAFENFGVSNVVNLSAMFPLWSQTNASQTPTANIKDRIPDAGYFLYDTNTGGTAIVGSTLSSEKEILTFGIANQIGSTNIDSANGTISVVMPDGTSLSNQISTFTLSENSGGAYVSGIFQESGVTQNDFTIDTIYNVIAEDLSEKSWTVSVKHENDVDTISPTISNTAITASGETESSVDLSWTKSTDDTTAAENLTYQVYYSESDNMAAVVDAEANGTVFGAAAADMDASTVTGLSDSTDYYFTVVVSDEAGNKSIYDTAGATTSTPIPSVDTISPTVSNTAITASGETESSVDLSWTKSTDDTTAAENLTYQVYYSES
ncbi:MAG: fibronectin type III domain-containing protein, partial [Bacillota bacterium]|nr:fibronectin type III domain-containing protein [Bacillota bacterium]